MVSPSSPQQSNMTVEARALRQRQQQQAPNVTSSSQPQEPADNKKTIPAPVPAVNVWQARKSAALKSLDNNGNGNLVKHAENGKQ